MNRADVTRRHILQAAAAAFVGTGLTRAHSSERATALAAPEPIAQLHAGATLLAVSTSGVLWRRAAMRWERIADGLDPAAPIAQAHGRVVGRGRNASLWVLESGQVRDASAPTLAPHAGFAVLPLGVIAVARIDDARGALIRMEPDVAGWVETARCGEPVLPDARALQVDLDGPRARSSDGHIVVLGAPDSSRYPHGVLGDAIEATRVLYLERHDLSVMRELSVAAPYVLEDIAPRPVEWQGSTGLLTMRSGPHGAQLAVIAADRAGRDALTIAALGEALGTRNRWMAASTDGRRIVAVHTPHIGGVLHSYRVEGAMLRAERVRDGVSTHVIGTRELDLAVWSGDTLMLPSQDRHSLLRLDIKSGWRELGVVPLAAAVIAARAWSSRGQPGAVLLLADGSLHWVASR
jgi:hypothetical protein